SAGGSAEWGYSWGRIVRPARDGPGRRMATTWPPDLAGPRPTAGDLPATRRRGRENPGKGGHPAGRRASSAQLAELDGTQAVGGDARRLGARILRLDLGQGRLRLAHLALAELGQAQLQQRARRLVVGGIALDQAAELLACKRVVAGGVVALAQPVQRVGRIDAGRVGIKEGL